jgi:flagellar assembly protein FliH
LHKIIKPQSTNKLCDAIEIPDLYINDDILEETENEECNEKVKIAKELYEKLVENANAYTEQIRERILKKTNEERDAILNAARYEALEIQKSARKEADDIIQQAKDSYEQIADDAFNEGLEKGIAQKADAVEELISEIKETMSELKEAQLQYMKDYAQEIKWLSLEIAEKIISKRLDEDDLVLVNIIKPILKNIHDAKWVTIQISDKFPELLERVIKEMSINDIDARIEVKQLKDVDKGTCIIQLEDRIIDASVLTQIKNMEEYFKTGDDTVYA